MNCMLCGTENRPEATRCKGCGASLTSIDAGPLGRTPEATILPGAPPPSGSAHAQERKTRLVLPDEPAAPAGGRRKTVFVAPEEAAAADAAARGVAGAAPTARLAGFLVTFTWNPAGEHFPLRDGKNTVGTEAARCEVALPRDRAMSGQHFAILLRRGQVRVRDLDSTNATVVDGAEVWGDSVEAAHGTVIRAGDTRFQLVLVPPLPEED